MLCKRDQLPYQKYVHFANSPQDIILALGRPFYTVSVSFVRFRVLVPLFHSFWVFSVLVCFFLRISRKLYVLQCRGWIRFGSVGTGKNVTMQIRYDK